MTDDSKSDGIDKEIDESRTISRRPFLKATSVGLLGGLAGCGGNGDGGDGGGGDGGDGGGGDGGGGDGGDGGGGDGGGGDGGDGGTPTAAATADLSDVEIDFWERQYFDESPAAEESLNQIMTSFEDQTGATVNVNYQGDDQPLIDAFNQGTYPQGMTEFAQGMGTWLQTEQVLPFEEYQDQFDYDVMDSVGALSQALEFTARGFSQGNTIFPITANIFAPFVGRTDLIEQAGYDPESDFPPENFDELVEMAQTIEDNTQAQHGYQPVHDTVDNQDVYFNQWMAADAGVEGYFFNEDMTDLNYQTDTWQTWLQRDIDLYREHGFGTPDTPSMNDEEIPPLHMNGTVAISNQAPMNLPGFVERGGDFYDENFRWAPSFGLETGVNGRALIPGGVLMQAPDGADQATWDRKIDATIELLSFFNDPVLQVETMPDLGFFPANQNLWPEIPNEMNGFAETIKQTAQNAKYGYTAHPDFGPIGYDIFGAKKQQASQGEKSVDAVLEESYNEGMEAMEGTELA